VYPAPINSFGASWWAILIGYDRRVNLGAFVLAGGKSSRMGRDKAFLAFGGETLLSRSLRLARSVTESVSIVGDTKKFGSFAPVVEDTYRDRGPLGGIHAALSTTRSEHNLIMAVDLPFLDVRFLQYLIAQAQRSEAMVTVPQMGGVAQPLCAVYRRELAALAEDALCNGRNKIDLLFAETNSRIIVELELRAAGFSADIFRYLNTPKDLEEALESLQRPGCIG